MRLLLLKALVGFVVGAGAGIADDANRFRTFRKDDELAKFCWPLACFRWLSGGIYGLLSAMGIAGAESIGAYLNREIKPYYEFEEADAETSAG